MTNTGVPSGHADPIRAEVDLNAIHNNLLILQRIAGQGTGLMAVVKANAYGHGAIRVAQTAVRAGATCLGVARLDEALELRRAGISHPVLIFGPSPAERVKELAADRLTQSVCSLASANALSQAAVAAGVRITVHLKIDSGMGRLGLLTTGRQKEEDTVEGSTLESIRALIRLPGLFPEGIFTHFASADHKDKESTFRQLARFQRILDELKSAGITFPLQHAANSAAILTVKESHFNMVRAGIAMYGLAPSAEVDVTRHGLRPAMSLKTEIVQLKRVEAGFPVSYGATYQTPKPTLIATVPLGYGDGYSRRFSNRGVMLVRGVRVPVVGRVCMDLTMLDVGDVPGVSLYDGVTVFGEQNGNVLSAEEVASLNETINYEVVTALTARVPRIYREADTPKRK